MLIRLVSSAKKVVDTSKNNLWDKSIFLDDKDFFTVHNTIIKCNRDIFIDINEIKNLIGLLTTKILIPDEGCDIIASGTCRLLENLEQNFRDSIVTPYTPDTSKFYSLGISVNNQNQHSNIEIEYSINGDVNNRVSLNLHMIARSDVKAQAAFQEIEKAARNFKDDERSLNLLKAINLDNFEENNYKIAQKSEGAYKAYQQAKADRLEKNELPSMPRPTF